MCLYVFIYMIYKRYRLLHYSRLRLFPFYMMIVVVCVSVLLRRVHDVTMVIAHTHETPPT